MNNNLVGQTIGGRYHIIQELGSGTFGTTFIAEDKQLPEENNRCVVKQFTYQYNDSSELQTATRLFELEAKVLNKLGKHNCIPQLLAYFEENQQFFLVQELIAGHDLSVEINRDKQLSESDVLDLLTKMLEVLNYVHQKHVIHRDLKPSNLMRRQSDGEIVLIDFGTVKQKINPQNLNAQTQFNSTVCVGTPGYMPSEQFNGCPGFYSDVYAVGTIAIQALTGVSPHRLKKDSDGEVVWRDRINSEADYNPDLLNIIDKMVRYHFKERYPSAAEALLDLNTKIISPSLTDSTSSPTPEKPLTKIPWKILVPLLFAGVSIPLVLWGVNISPTEEWNTYENSSYGIKIDYPESWHRQGINSLHEKGDRFISLRENNSDTFRENVSVVIEDLSPPLSLAEYTEHAMEQIRNNFDNIISEPQEYTLANGRAIYVIYEKQDSGLNLQYMQAWTVRNNQAYVITYTAEKGGVKKFKRQAEKMIKSFQIGS